MVKTECEDKDPSCPLSAAEGHCDQVFRYCRVSCNACPKGDLQTLFFHPSELISQIEMFKLSSRHQDKIRFLRFPFSQ